VGVNDVITAFSIKPPSQYMSSPQLKSIVIRGLTMDEFDSVCSDFGELTEFRRVLAKECDEVVQKAANAQAKLDGFAANKKQIAVRCNLDIRCSRLLQDSESVYRGDHEDQPTAAESVEGQHSRQRRIRQFNNRSRV